ncbi:ubiquinol-cytochrome C reductase, partial [Podospora didyma]
AGSWRLGFAGESFSQSEHIPGTSAAVFLAGQFCSTQFRRHRKHRDLGTDCSRIPLTIHPHDADRGRRNLNCSVRQPKSTVKMAAARSSFALFRRNYTMLGVVFAGAFGFEMFYNTSMDKVWDNINRGRQWKDIRHKYVADAEEED